MKTAIVIAIDRLLIKELICFLGAFIRHAPRFFADVVRDINPAVNDVRNIFQGGETSRFSTGLLQLPGERSQRAANFRERIVNGAIIFFLGGCVGAATVVLALIYMPIYGWVAHMVFWIVFGDAYCFNLGFGTWPALSKRQLSHRLSRHEKSERNWKNTLRRPRLSCFNHGFYIRQWRQRGC